jgi:hypothetical protein
METLLIGVKARFMPTIDLVVKVPAGMAVAWASNLHTSCIHPEGRGPKTEEPVPKNRL